MSERLIASARALESSSATSLCTILRLVFLMASGIRRVGTSFFGIAVYDGETCKGRVTGNYAGSFTCEYPASSLVTGRTYTCYPFICGKKKTIASAEEQDFYFTLPNVLPASFKVVSSMELNGIHVTLEARYSFYADTGAENRSIILVSGNVYGDNGLSLTNNYLICRFMNSPENSAMQPGEKQVKLSDMNTSGTTPVKINQNFSGLDVKRDYVITLSLHSGAYKYKVDVMQQFVTICCCIVRLMIVLVRDIIIPMVVSPSFFVFLRYLS